MESCNIKQSKIVIEDQHKQISSLKRLHTVFTRTNAAPNQCLLEDYTKKLDATYNNIS